MKTVLAERGAPGSVAEGWARPEHWPVDRPFRIEGLEIANRLVQAPLAGIGNWAFRRQSRRHGAGLTISEMVSSHAILHGNRRTLRMLDIAPDEHPVGVQIFGADPRVMAEAARIVEAAGADLIDVNMGCPAGKITKTGAGAALLDDPRTAAEVITAMRRAVRIPVTVKMRRGMTSARSRPSETARVLEAAGAAAICMHPRAAAEEYGGTADHRITAEVAAAVAVPVIASGDVIGPREAHRLLEAGACTAVAVGRGALGNPWALGDIARGEIRPRPNLDEVVAELERFAADARQAVGEDRVTGYMRKFYGWYLAGPHVSRDEVLALQTAPSLDAALERLRDIAAAAPA